MINLTDEQITEIVGEHSIGMKCYYNLVTGRLVIVPDTMQFPDIDSDSWDEDFEELEENWGDYHEFKKMESRQAFEIMEDFAETVEDRNLRSQLLNALERTKPFSNFKWTVDNSGPYRQQWFDFKDAREFEWIKEQMDEHNIIEALKNDAPSE